MTYEYVYLWPMYKEYVPLWFTPQKSEHHRHTVMLYGPLGEPLKVNIYLIWKVYALSNVHYIHLKHNTALDLYQWNAIFVLVD